MAKSSNRKTTPKPGGYIERSQGSGETIFAIARFHWWYILKAWLALIFLWWLLGYGIYLFFAMMIKKWTTEIGVTSHRFVIKTGLIKLDTNEIALQNIEGVRVSQHVWGRMLGYGRVRIEGTGVDAIEIPNIADPVDFRAAIESAKDNEIKEMKKKA
jgi:uncharacterized membrane protein YdbT with pleckstrin-like domain